MLKWHQLWVDAKCLPQSNVATDIILFYKWLKEDLISMLPSSTVMDFRLYECYPLHMQPSFLWMAKCHACWEGFMESRHNTNLMRQIAIIGMRHNWPRVHYSNSVPLLVFSLMTFLLHVTSSTLIVKAVILSNPFPFPWLHEKRKFRKQ